RILALDEAEDPRQHGRDGRQVLLADHLGAKSLQTSPVERPRGPRIRCGVSHSRPPALGLSAVRTGILKARRHGSGADVVAAAGGCPAGATSTALAGGMLPASLDLDPDELYPCVPDLSGD